MPAPDKLWTVILQVVFYCLVGVFVVSVALSADFNQLKHIEWRIDYLVYAAVTALVFRYIGVTTWINILRHLGCIELPGFATLSRIYAKAWMGRYIPGKVAWIVGKVLFGSRYGISVDRLAVGSSLEAILQIVTSFGFALVLILLDQRLNVMGAWSVPLLCLVIAGFVIVLIPRCFARLLAFAYRILRREQAVTIQLTGSLMLSSVLLYAAGFLVSGLSYYFLINAVYDLSLTNVWFVIAAFNLAGVIGTLALFAPSGLGVREGVLLVLLPVLLPVELALLVVVLARLFSLAVDLGFFLISHLPLARWESSVTS